MKSLNERDSNLQCQVTCVFETEYQ